MCNKNVQKKIMERVVKQEAKEEQEEEEVEVEEEQRDTQEPHVPPPAQVNMECQTDESSLTDSKPGSSSKKEEPVPPEGSSKKEESGEKKTDIQHDDAAPEEKPVKRTYYGYDITGNEDDSVFRKLKDCFSDGYHGEWAGFYNQAYPASSMHRHMFWHVKYRATMAQHQDYWYHLTDDQLMTEYIARHKDQQPLQELEDLKNTIEYGCSDPRLHPRHQEHSEEASKEAEKRIDDDFNLTGVLQAYVEEHKVLPYCVILHCLASRYIGGGLIDPTYKDEEYPYRSSLQFSLMFWNLGNWCRNRFDKCPVPERLQRFVPHVDYNMDEDHNQIDQDKSQITIISSMSSRTLGDIFS